MTVYKRASSRLNEGMTNSKTILIVEDHQNILKIFHEFVSFLEHHPVIAKSAEDALKILDELDGKVNLVICDIMLPGIRGDDMARRIKAKYPHIKILCISGDDSLSPPDFPFIHKPFRMSSLTDKISELLEDEQ